MKTKALVIVESPAKARTLSKFLGTDYSVKASLGHIRDLPKNQLGVDVENDFTPKYTVPKKKSAVVREMRKAAKEASSVYLATDPDREGESISWHITQVIPVDKVPIHRVIFHEITERAIEEAFRHPMGIDMCLVNAQQARRILDRLVGYKMSPLLWQKVRRGLSAGRVQSVALRMLVEREREIENFVPTEYWSIEAELAHCSTSFRAGLIGLADKEKLEIRSEKEAQDIVAQLERANFSVAKVTKKKVLRQPPPPFITSTLQQEAWHKFRFSAKRTMMLAQQLYEGLPLGEEGRVGLITYMRTDSTRMSDVAVAEIRTYVAQKYGAKFVPHHPRRFLKKAKGAQEAHEAIRPTSVGREPELIKPHLTSDQAKLYQLIWKRALSSQMSAASFDNTVVDIEAEVPKTGKTYLFRASSSIRDFPGFLVLHDEKKETPTPLPQLKEGEKLLLLGLFREQHFTQPPPHYTEATLIKVLEENGIGRPSTYAPILSAIQERGYVQRASGRLQPKEIGVVVNDFLTKHFHNIVNVEFTAHMEEELDKIAQGERDWKAILRRFYPPFEETLSRVANEVERAEIPWRPAGELCPNCGKPMVIKTGRYGEFIACTDYPRCKTTKPLVIRTGVACPQCGGELIEKRSKRGRVFYGCSNYPRCRFALNRKPLPYPCPECGSLLTLKGKERTSCTKCKYEGSTKELSAKV
jgi:DNA topoisomerase-1